MFSFLSPSRWVGLLGVSLASTGVVHAQDNHLLRSGTIAQFADTKIYQANGVEVSVGEVQNSYFPGADALAASLASAAQANGVIEPGWQTTSTYEEWTDRLVLTRTVTYTLLDGAAFQANHATGLPFQPSPNIVEDPTPAPDMLQLVTEFIEDDGHLALYPAARDAGNDGPEALIEELERDVGPVTYTERIQFSRKLQEQETLSGWQSSVSHLATPPVEGQPLEPNYVTQNGLRFDKPNSFDPVVPDPPVDHTGGIGCYEQPMLNGFTASCDYTMEIEMGKPASSINIFCFMNYGLGLRIPWEAKVAVEPKLITELRPDLEPFTSEISINTLDADSSFYTAVGLSSDEVYDGKELQLQAGIGVAVAVTLFGKVVFHRSPWDPLFGGVVDESMNFDPPMNGNTVNLTGPIFPYELTGLGYNGWMLGLGTDVKATAGIVGQGFDLNVAPHNAWNALTGGGVSTSVRTLAVTQENIPSSLPFKVDDSSPKSMSLGGDHYYRHGAVYSEGIYKTNTAITPSIRIRGTVKFSAISKLLNDWNISTPFIPLFTVVLDGPDIDTHADTEGTIEAYHLNRRELGPAPDGTIQHDFAHDGANTWTVSILPDCVAAVGQVTEFLVPGETVLPGSIMGGGVYDPNEHTIVWQFDDGVPEEISYRLAGPIGSRPKPLATWVPEGRTEEETVLPAGGGNLTAAQDALLMRSLSQRPTWEEVIDARPGSTLLEADSQRKVRLFFQLDTSDDLEDWDTVQETVASPLEVEFQLPADKRFFRFRQD